MKNYKKNVEKITPYNDNESKSAQIETAFDRIAQRYDFMNRLLSMGIDTSWRRKALRSLGDITPVQILDVAAGTGDLSIMAAKKFRRAEVTGIDLSQKMLDIAKNKAKRKVPSQQIHFVQGDCLKMPFADDTFDLATIAFGIRNFENINTGCQEIRRVLKPGGILLIIELSRPQNKILSCFYNLYLNHVIPVLGRVLTGSTSEYRYLPESIKYVPQGAEMLALLGDAGFSNRSLVTHTFGICTCYTVEK